MPMLKSQLRGMFPAFPTPFAADGSLALGKLDGYIESLVNAGIGGLVPVGGTGEFTALSEAERVAVTARTVELARGRVPVVGGILHPGFADATALGKALVQAGADALMVVAPFYVIPAQAGILDYYRAYRDKVDADLILYDVPSRTRVSVEPDTVARLAEEGVIIGMKASNTDAHHFNRLMAAVGDKASILSGDESVFPTQVVLGAVGGVLASAAIFPRPWNEIMALVAAGKVRDAVALHRSLSALCDALFCETNPGPLKQAMKMVGHDFGDVRLPLRSASPQAVDRLKALVAQRKSLFF